MIKNKYSSIIYDYVQKVKSTFGNELDMILVIGSSCGGKVIENWTADHDEFLSSMADSASSVVNLFNNNIIYINVMSNMSVDCDCCAKAEDPCMQDIGILMSTDPVAIDKACLDLVYSSQDPGKDHLIERIESRHGIYTIECAEKLGIGTTNYELIDID